MSLSRIANSGRDPARLGQLDFLLALLLHLFVIAALALTQAWPRTPPPLPPHAVQVALIPAPQQAVHRKPAKPKSAPKPTAVRQPPKPKTSKKTQTPGMPKAKGVASKRRSESKPSVKREVAQKPKAKKAPARKRYEENFDPFAPIQSKRSPASTSRRSESAPVEHPSLTRVEIDRYTARIRAAVERHWKVPARIGNVHTDPVVEMDLRPDGSVAAVRIVISSGNPALDDSLIRAIHAAAPFQLPPARFQSFRHNRIRFHPIP